VLMWKKLLKTAFKTLNLEQQIYNSGRPIMKGSSLIMERELVQAQYTMRATKDKKINDLIKAAKAIFTASGSLSTRVDLVEEAMTSLIEGLIPSEFVDSKEVKKEYWGRTIALLDYLVNKTPYAGKIPEVSNMVDMLEKSGVSKLFRPVVAFELRVQMAHAYAWSVERFDTDDEKKISYPKAIQYAQALVDELDPEKHPEISLDSDRRLILAKAYLALGEVYSYQWNGKDYKSSIENVEKAIKLFDPLNPATNRLAMTEEDQITLGDLLTQLGDSNTYAYADKVKVAEGKVETDEAAESAYKKAFKVINNEVKTREDQMIMMFRLYVGYSQYYEIINEPFKTAQFLKQAQEIKETLKNGVENE